jgi:hypothetical protein
MMTCEKTTHDGNIICFKVGVEDRKISWKQLSVYVRGCCLFHYVRDCGRREAVSCTRKNRFPYSSKIHVSNLILRLPVMSGKTIKRSEYKKHGKYNF